jgi:16S rRNA (guanine966-N2)-methyltransferase
MAFANFVGGAVPRHRKRTCARPGRGRAQAAGRRAYIDGVQFDWELGVRVTGGRFGGRKLRTPKSGVRPTADRVRESRFKRKGVHESAKVQDIICGSGALGVEALSRGAESLVSVERSRSVRDVLQANLDALEVGECARVMAGDAIVAVGRLARAGERFHLVLLDPPYASGDAGPVLEAIAEAGLLEPHGVVVLERSRSHPLPEVTGLVPVDERRYGDTMITQFQLPATGSEPSESLPGGSVAT